MNEWTAVFVALRRYGAFTIVGLAAGLAVAAAVTVFQKPVWEARMIAAPAQRTGIPNLSSFLPPFEGAGAGAPVLQYFVDRIDSANASDFSALTTLITGPGIAERLYTERPGRIPAADNAAEAALWLDHALTVRPVGTTPFRRLSIRHDDPQTALALLERAFTLADETLRQRAMATAKGRIAYLTKTLETTRHPDHRDALLALLKEQERTAMTVAIDDYFAAAIIEPPAVHPRPVSPNPVILFPGLGFAGLLLGLLIGGMRSAWMDLRARRD